MPSSHPVPIVAVESIEKLPNADRLGLAKVLGWQVVVNITQHAWEVGEPALYVPPDSLVPEALAKAWGVDKYLGPNGRVCAARLRGERSFGFLIPLSEVPMNGTHPVGTDLSAALGIGHYEADVTEIPGAIPAPAAFLPYTSVENLRNHPDILEPGEEVCITEKIDGMSARYALIDGEFWVGSHRVAYRMPLLGDPLPLRQNPFWAAVTPAIRRLLEGLPGQSKILYGEVHGRMPSGERIGKLDYAMKGLFFRAFDLALDGRFMDALEFITTCDEAGVYRAPFDYAGPYGTQWPVTLAEEPSAIGDGCIKEGVVIRPVVERTHPKIGRVILKYHSDAYLLGPGR